jgi:hypothetical protein
LELADGGGGGQAEEKVADVQDVMWAGGGREVGVGGYEGLFRWVKQGLCLMRTAAALATRKLARLRGGGWLAMGGRGFFDCT